jgi:methylmalonyl-CoA mutase
LLAQLKGETPIEVRQIDNSVVREQQIARLNKIRASRDSKAVQAALAAITDAARSGSCLAHQAACVRG